MKAKSPRAAGVDRAADSRRAGHAAAAKPRAAGAARGDARAPAAGGRSPGKAIAPPAAPAPRADDRFGCAPSAADDPWRDLHPCRVWPD